MDPITQGALGAACGQCTSRPQKLVAATIAGTLAGMAADTDVLIRSGSDPLLFLEFHRHFTHSLIFIPVGALLCALVAHRVLRRLISFPEAFFACLAGYASHGLLDACTSYGTLLLWPFSDARIAWNNISVIDPLFTVPVMLLVVLAARLKRKIYAALALCWAVAYLALGYVQMERALAAGMALAESRGHQPLRARAMPSIGNLWLWRHIYVHDGRIYADAVRAAAETTLFEGSSLPELDISTDFSWLDSDTTQSRDLRRFAHFADDYLGVDRANGNRIVDLRYSALPNAVIGIWSITLDPNADPAQHIRFDTDRITEPGQADELFRMLFGAR